MPTAFRDHRHQASVEDYQAEMQLMALDCEHAFVSWLRNNRTDTGLTAHVMSYQLPAATLSD